MKKSRLIGTENRSRSVIELYLSEDGKLITEVKCLTENRCKEYEYPVEDFMKRNDLTANLKRQVASAMDK